MTILSRAKDSHGVKKKLGNSLLKLTIILSLASWLMLPVVTLAAPVHATPGDPTAAPTSVNDFFPGSVPTDDPVDKVITKVGTNNTVNLTPGTAATPATTGTNPTASTPPIGSGSRLSLKKLLGDDNFDFSKLTLADAGKALLTIIDWAIALSGGVALIYIIWGGVEYLTAGGNEEHTKKAKTTITWAVVGLILVITSYAIIKYFSRTLGADIPIQ